jgi:hypothetical protein
MPANLQIQRVPRPHAVRLRAWQRNLSSIQHAMSHEIQKFKIELIIWCYDRAIVAVRLSSNRLDRNANMNKLGSSAGESVRQI